MAAAFLKNLDPSLRVESAGTRPAPRVHPFAVRAMQEEGIDISGERPKHVDQFLDRSFDYCITVCDNARNTCPHFRGKVAHRMHFGFDDPAAEAGSEAQVLGKFRRIRDEIKSAFDEFYRTRITAAK